MPDADDLKIQASLRFRRMVESVGVKRFASDMGLSTRQVNRMLSGAQPNPVERIIRSLQCCEADIGDETLGFICQEAGGHFFKEEGQVSGDGAAVVKRCAEAMEGGGESDPPRDLSEADVLSAIRTLIGLLEDVRSERDRQRPVVRTRPMNPPATHRQS